MAFEFYPTPFGKKAFPQLPQSADCEHLPERVEVEPDIKFLNNIYHFRCAACERRWELRGGRGYVTK